MAEVAIKRGKINGYTHAKADARKARKRQEAEERQEVWDALPLEEKLKLMGKKHRVRWDKQQAELAKKKVVTPTPIPASVVATPATEVKPAKKKKYQKAKKS
jgi:hypothetical protein